MRVVSKMTPAAIMLFVLVGCSNGATTASPSLQTTSAASSDINQMLVISTLPDCKSIFVKFLALPGLVHEHRDRITVVAPKPMRLCRYRSEQSPKLNLSLIAEVTLPTAPVAMLRTFSHLRAIREVYGSDPNGKIACPRSTGAFDAMIFRAATRSGFTLIKVERDGCRLVIVTNTSHIGYSVYVGTAELLVQLDAIKTNS